MNNVANKNVEIINKAQFDGKETLAVRESSSQEYYGVNRRA